MILMSVIMEGGNPAGLLNIPALMIVVGGTMGVTMACTSIEQMKRIPALYKIAIGGSKLDARGAASSMVALSEKARREGLLALEKEVAAMDDEFTKKGVQLIVDGTDSSLVRTILQSEMDGMAQRHQASAHLFATAGGFGPTLGILGTVLSLVHVLENLSDPGSLGHSIAGAFLATLYGVGSANVIYLPVSNKLKELAAEEQNYRYMLLDAILSIQAGDNPRLLADKLQTYLEPSERGEELGTKPAEAAAGAAAPAEAAKAA